MIAGYYLPITEKSPQVLAMPPGWDNLCYALELAKGKSILLSIDASLLLDEFAELKGVVLTIEDKLRRI